MNTDELVIAACIGESTMALAAKKVNLPYSTFKRKAIQLNVWKPNQGAKGTSKATTSLDDVFSGKIKMCSSALRKRLISEGYKENKCEECNMDAVWNGITLTLELHHVNGIKKDNSYLNLRLLCPNCHSQTPTFRGRNTQ
jgi:5-methylcytosine-specific restriction endonuclease McrA